MGFCVRWILLGGLSCLLFLAGQVHCDCTEEGMQMEGGHYTLTKGLERGSQIIYHCPVGFYPSPATFRLCQANGSWKPAPKRFTPQTCKLVECPDPNVLEFGSVEPFLDKYVVDNVTSYECYSGYTLRGSRERICLANGKWSGSTPVCSRDSGDHCADPGVPPGASRYGNMFGIDDVVKYSCNADLILVGSSERVCQENGHWTGIEPACYYKHTYDTPLEVSQAFGSGIQNSLTILRSTDIIKEGRMIKLQKNGTLNIYIAVDVSESIEKEHFENAQKAVITLIDKIASFSVNPNYEIVFFSSTVTEAVNIIDFYTGRIERAEIKNCVEKVDKGDLSTGTDLKKVFDTFLERMAFIKTHVGVEKFKEHHHAIILFTDGAYNMGGSPAPSVERIKNMVYMNHTSGTEAQSREEFLDIYIFAIGSQIFDDDLQPLALGTGGKHYFKMKDIYNLQETFDEIIDQSNVKGLCGLHVDYETDVKRKKYPWWALVSVQSEVSAKNCLGSLVSPQFILTAAHCFTFGNLPEHVTVEIGSHVVKGVETFKIHPQYNINLKAKEGVKEFYDYDVALIQLKEPVYISTEIRPICIPCTQETSDALQLVGESTCKQQEELLLKTHLESLSFLSKSGINVNKKDIHVKLGDNRDECISHAVGADGIDTDDPKIPVTDNFLCSGGRQPFRDDIACKGDSGGAVFKNVEQRTIQIAVVSWGTKDMCKGNVLESDDASRDFHINLFRVVPFLKSVLGNDSFFYEPLNFLDH